MKHTLLATCDLADLYLAIKPGADAVFFKALLMHGIDNALNLKIKINLI